MKHILLLLLFILCGLVMRSQNKASERCAAFGKGMNLSNWLEAGWQSGWPTSTGYTKSDLLKMKEAGIQSIRLPICFALITDSISPYTIDTNHALFTRIDSVLAWATELNLNLIIDNHHEWSLLSNNWRYQIPRFGHMWSYVSERYKNTDPRYVTFELLNEPSVTFPIDSLNILFYAGIDSIRKHTTAHSIIVSPNGGSVGLAFSNYQPLTDTNLIYTWHCYDPLNFTHQGFAWGQLFPSGTPFPSTPTTFYEQFLYDGINRVNTWRNTYNKPLFLGELGVSVYADAESRCRWMQLMGANLDTTHIPWFYWDWQWDFSIFNSQIISADSVIPCFRSALHLYGDTLTSVTNMSDEIGFKLFPNPVNGGSELKIVLPGVVVGEDANQVPLYELKITAVTGKVLINERVSGSTSIPIQLLRGIYFVYVSNSQNRNCVKKLVVE